jgi:hypothetical protein
MGSEFNRVSDLFNRGGRNFTDNSKPKISLPLTDDIHGALLQGTLCTALRPRLNKHGNRGESIGENNL